MLSDELTPLQKELAKLDKITEKCPDCHNNSLACSFHAEKYVDVMVNFDGDDLE